MTGSAAGGREDRWSDIDLAFGVADGFEKDAVIADWTSRMYERYQVAHHYDVLVGPWTYRVFLLPNGLQVDVAFVPASHFGPRAPTFNLVFGTAKEIAKPPPADVSEMIGLAWVYLLHVRSSLARGQLWQAEYMLSTARNYVLAIASLRHGLPANEGRGMDQLPQSVKDSLANSFVARLDPADVAAALSLVVDALLVEIGEFDGALLQRLSPVLNDLRETVSEMSKA